MSDNQPDQALPEPAASPEMEPHYETPYESMPEPQEEPAPATLLDAVVEEDVPVYYYCFGWIVILVVLAGLVFGAWWMFLRDDDGAEVLPPPIDSGDGTDDLIGPDGGEAVSPDGAKITVPKGALDTRVKVEIVKVTDGRVTNLYHLKPDGQEFKKAVTVLLPYKERGLYAGETPYDIFLNYQYTRYGTKNRVATTVNTSSKVVSTRVTRF